MPSALVIDDSKTQLFVTQRHLESMGYRVDTLDAPLLLVEKLKRSRPELMLLDVQMPAIGGARLLGITRAFGLLDGITVVLHSANDPAELKSLAASFGAAGWIRKTADRERFREELTEVLGAARGARPPKRDEAAEVLTGVAAIDEQHATILRGLAEISERLGAGKGRESLEGFMGFLTDFVEYHFALEETWMETTAFPGTAEHKADHARIRAVSEGFRERMREAGATTLLAIEVHSEIHPMYRRHITTFDRAMAEHLRKFPPPRA